MTDTAAARHGPTIAGTRRWPVVALWAAVIVGAAAVVTAVVAHRATQDAGVFFLPMGTLSVVLVTGFVAARHVERRHAVVVILAGAVLFRLPLLATVPDLSNDLYRYLWDGRVQAAGVNPYAYPPDAEVLAGFRDDQVHPNINRPDERTIYPGGAQLVFVALHLVGVRGVTALKALLVAVDLAVVWLLLGVLWRAGRDRRLVLLYAWNPLVVLAVAQSGHFDVLVALTLVLAVRAWQRGRATAAGAWVGAAAALKLFPLLVLPALLRRRGAARARSRQAWAWLAVPAALGVVAVTYLPYLAVGRRVLGFLTTGYLDEEGYTSGGRFVLAEALGVDGILLAAVAGVGVAAWALVSARAAPAKAAALLGAALLLTTPYPWYAVALVALATAGGPGVGTDVPWGAGELIWPLFAVALQFIYLAFFNPVGIVNDAFRLPTILAVLAALALTWWRRRPLSSRPSAAGAP